MSYRSDVTYAIWFETVADRDTFIDVVLTRNDKHMIEALTDCYIGTVMPDMYTEVDEEKPMGLIKFAVKDIEWYANTGDPAYAYIDGHEALLELINQAFDDVAGARFIRMGENEDDIVEHDYGYSALIDHDALYVVRHVEAPEVDNQMTLDIWKQKAA